MITTMTVFMALAMIGTAGVLVAGLVSLARSSSDPRKSNKLMQWRIGLQAIALVLAVIMIALHRP